MVGWVSRSHFSGDCPEAQRKVGTARFCRLQEDQVRPGLPAPCPLSLFITLFSITPDVSSLGGSSGLFLHRLICIVRMIIQDFISIKKVVFLISSRLNNPGRQDNFLYALAYFSIYWTLNKNPVYKTTLICVLVWSILAY